MVGLGLCPAKKAQHNFWPAKQEEEEEADEAESKQNENVDSPAWSPLGRREAKQASPSAGRFLCHSRRRCDDDDDKATKTSSRQRGGEGVEQREEGSTG